jgi:uracil-DNA glycosylase family 4
MSDDRSLPVVYPTASGVGCFRCPALCASRTQIVDGVGPDRPLLLVVGEAPGADEDVSGVPFVGRSGQLLRDSLAQLGISNAQVRFTNAVRCHPEGNRDPIPEEVENCSQWLDWEVGETQPRVILALGKIAQRAISVFEPNDAGILIVNAWHPAYVLRAPKSRPAWLKQLAPAVDYALGRQVVPSGPPEPEPWYEHWPETEHRLDWSSPWLAIDTETDDLEEGYGVKLVSWQISDGVTAKLQQHLAPRDLSVPHLLGAQRQVRRSPGRHKPQKSRRLGRHRPRGLRPPVRASRPEDPRPPAHRPGDGPDQGDPDPHRDDRWGFYKSGPRKGQPKIEDQEGQAVLLRGPGP